jgi:hypothetical protein
MALNLSQTRARRRTAWLSRADTPRRRAHSAIEG